MSVSSLVCGKETPGGPCMRISGHSGGCLPGNAAETIARELNQSPELWEPIFPRLPARYIVIFCLAAIAISFQAFLDTLVFIHFAG